MLEVGDRIDPTGIGRLPSPFRQPDRGLESRFRAGVADIRHDHEEDVFGLPVGVLQRFVSEELRIILAEKDSVICRELKEGAAGGSDQHQNEAGRNNRPARLDHPLRKACLERPRRVAGLVYHRWNRYPRMQRAAENARTRSSRNPLEEFVAGWKNSGA